MNEEIFNEFRKIAINFISSRNLVQILNWEIEKCSIISENDSIKFNYSISGNVNCYSRIWIINQLEDFKNPIYSKDNFKSQIESQIIEDVHNWLVSRRK